MSLNFGAGRVAESRFSTMPCSAPESSPALGVPASSALAALLAVEELPPGATGALVFEEQGVERGAVLVEGGRVCWAVAAAMRRRLTDLLRHQHDPPIDEGTFEKVYVRCRSEGTPLGEALVKTGLVTERGLRSALRQHNAEAIALLGGSSGRSFRERAGTRYDARYTFSTVDLLTSLGSLRDEAETRKSRWRLREMADNACLGVAYLRQGGAGPVPVGAVGAEGISAADVVELGQWASSTLDLATAIDPERRLVASTRNDGKAAVVWMERTVTYVVLCEDSTGVARTLARVARLKS